MVFNFYNSIEESIHSERVKDQDRTIYINSLDISPIEFDLNEDGKAKLIESGRKGVEDFLESKQNKKGRQIDFFLHLILLIVFYLILSLEVKK
jgi:hypothetical protein